MRGTGERLIDVTAPDLPIVLVNPGMALETRKVFERFDQLGANRTFRETAPPDAHDFNAFLAQLSAFRNDLETPATALMPEIGKALAAIRSEPGCRLARMSGSGPTCFGIFDSDEEVDAAARRIAEKKRKYWVRATTLRGASYTGG
jgi:4-diphosphocytidyl-2-C-methyl-D-erythritol kinase